MEEEEGLGESGSPDDVQSEADREWLARQQRETAWLLELAKRKWWQWTRRELLYAAVERLFSGTVAILVVGAITVLVWQCGSWLIGGEWTSLSVWDGIRWLDSHGIVPWEAQYSFFQTFEGADKVALWCPLWLGFCVLAFVLLSVFLAIPRPAPPPPPEDFQPPPLPDRP
jgi:hypothetical protein